MRKHWMWSLGIVVCLVPILAAQEIYKEMILLDDTAPSTAEVSEKCSGTQCANKDSVPNPKELARLRQKKLAESVAKYNKYVAAGEYRKARTIARQVIETMPEDPVAELMWHQIQTIEKLQAGQKPEVKLPREVKNWQELKASRQKKVRPAPKKDQLVTVTYPVGDLVIPIPKKATVSLVPEIKAEAPKQVKPEYQPLISLIKDTIAPESWDSKRGKGTITPYVTTLSVIIRQTQDVHEQVADLLEQLRRLQDIQIAYEVRVLSVDDTNGTWYETYNEACKTKMGPQTRQQILSDAQMRKFINHAQGEVRTNILMAPKVCLFNGQTLEMQLGKQKEGLRKVLSHGVVTADRRFVRLNTAVNCSTPDEVIAGTLSSSVPDGCTLLIDPDVTTTKEGNPAGVPILSKIPYTSRLFRNTGPQKLTQRILLAITPRIIILEEEEELLRQTPQVRAGTVKARVIIQEEEEELLGIPQAPGGTKVPAKTVKSREALLNVKIPQPEHDKAEKKAVPAAHSKPGQTLPSAQYLRDDVQYFPATAPLPKPVKPAPAATQDDLDYFLGKER